MNPNPCETCVHWREYEPDKNACDLGYLDSAFCGDNREEWE